MALLEVKDLVRGFRTAEGRRIVVDIPRFELAEGEQAALRGFSGSGKTTFLNLIAGLLPADRGSVSLDGIALTSLNEPARDRVRAQFIGYVFQTMNLLQGFTVLENIELAMFFAGRKDPARARALLHRLGLADRAGDQPRQLSTGQQQRVALARALANSPRLVLADEPTSHLDPARAAESMVLLREVCRESGAALLLVAHDPEAFAGFDRIEDFTRVNRALDKATDPAVETAGARAKVQA